MTGKRFKFSGHCEVYDTTDTYNTIDCSTSLDAEILYNLLNKLLDENEQLKKDVEYWKQVASQCSNESNIFEHHCKKYKTECKDIYWNGD